MGRRMFLLHSGLITSRDGLRSVDGCNPVAGDISAEPTSSQVGFAMQQLDRPAKAPAIITVNSPTHPAE